MEHWKPRLPAAKAVSLRVRSAESVSRWLFPTEKPRFRSFAPLHLQGNCLSLLACAALLTGCTAPPAQTPDQRLQSQAAKDARQVHHDVKQAGVEAHHALVAARRETRDIVAGAREGWREGGAKDGPIIGSGSGGHGRLDINRASASDLAELPGIHASTARRIVAGQPYTSTKDLVKRGLVTQNEYGRIRERIATH